MNNCPQWDTAFCDSPFGGHEMRPFMITDPRPESPVFDDSFDDDHTVMLNVLQVVCVSSHQIYTVGPPLLSGLCGHRKMRRQLTCPVRAQIG
jgi:hypothetical protein